MRKLTALAILVSLATATGAQDRADLTGVWKLNQELTAQAEVRLTEDRAAVAGRRAPLGGGPIGMGGSGRSPGAAGSGYSGGRQNPEDVAKAREAMRLALLSPERLTIVRDESGFVVTDGSGVSSKWKMDGKAVRSEAGALTIETKVKWDGSALVVERKFEGGVKATERYSVSANPRRLTIRSKVESNQLPGEPSRTTERVYDVQ